MKPAQPIQPIAERFPALEEKEVRFACYAPEAGSVFLAGTFNGWQPEANPMEMDADGEWSARLSLKSGQYEYRFVVDGVWTGDPETPQSAANPHSGRNAVIEVALDNTTELL